MAICSDNTQTRGTSNPIQSKIVENDHGSGSSALGDNSADGITCDASVAVGNVVRLSGSTAVNAQADNFANSKAIGICSAKASATECSITFIGPTSSIFTGLTPGESVFLSDTTAGEVTTTAPSTSNSYVIKIGTAFAINKISINIERIVKRV